MFQKWIRKFQIKRIKKLIFKYESKIQKLYNRIDNIWIKPECEKCIHKNDICCPNLFDCIGYKEQK